MLNMNWLQKLKELVNIVICAIFSSLRIIFKGISANKDWKIVDFSSSAIGFDFTYKVLVTSIVVEKSKA